MAGKKKIVGKAKKKKKGKYDITVGFDGTFDELMKIAITTPIKKSKVKAKPKK